MSDAGDEAGAADEHEPPGVPGVLAAFAAGDLPLGKTDQLVRFEESVRRVADPQLLEEDLGILLGHARDEVIASGPDGRTRTRVSGLDEKKLAAAITMTGRLLRPDKDLRDEDEALKASRSLTKSAGACGMTLPGGHGPRGRRDHRRRPGRTVGPGQEPRWHRG